MIVDIIIWHTNVDMFRIGDMLMSSFEGLSRSNITQQSSKASLFTSFEDVEVTVSITNIQHSYNKRL